MNVEKWNMHKIDLCEGGLKLSDIATKNVGENDLTPRMRYIMVRLDNWDRTIVQDGWNNKGWSMEQNSFMTILDLVEESTESVWNVCIKVWHMKRTLKNVCSRKTMLFLMKTLLKENYV